MIRGYSSDVKKINIWSGFILKFVAPFKMDHMKKLISAGFFVTLVAGMLVATPETVGQEAETTVQWMTFEEAVEKSKTEKRKIFIDVYTDWCGWCKVMDKKTFNEPAVAKLLNEKYYPVKFNAEQREDVVFNGTTFKFIEYGGRGTHQLAAALLNNQLSYPSVVFLNEEMAIVHIMKGFRKAPEFHKMAEFIGDDHYRSTKMDQWESGYQSPF